LNEEVARRVVLSVAVISRSRHIVKSAKSTDGRATSPYEKSLAPDRAKRHGRGDVGRRLRSGASPDAGLWRGHPRRSHRFVVERADRRPLQVRLTRRRPHHTAVSDGVATGCAALQIKGRRAASRHEGQRRERAGLNGPRPHRHGVRATRVPCAGRNGATHVQREANGALPPGVDLSLSLLRCGTHQ
jgi:hypothetical protein